MSLSVGVLGFPLSSRYWGGISWYTYRYIDNMAALDPGKSFHVVMYSEPPEGFPGDALAELVERHGNVDVVIKAKGSETIEWCKSHTDVVWGPSSGILRTDAFPQVFTHTDMRMFTRWRESYRNYLSHKMGLDHAMRKARIAISFSSFTTQETLRHYTGPEFKKKMATVYLGIPAGFSGTEGVTFKVPDGVGNRPFLTVIYDPLPQKRMDLLASVVPVLEEQGWDMVLIGGLRGGRTDTVIDHPNVHYTGFAGHGDLPSYIKASQLFLFLSEYEGFGLPPYEAMALRVPVVYNRRCEALRMDLGDRTHSFDGEGGLPSVLKELMRSVELREKWIDDCAAFVQRFDWRTSASRYLYLLEMAHEYRGREIDFEHDDPPLPQ